MRTAETPQNQRTDITVAVNLDGTGKHQIATGIGFPSITCSTSWRGIR